jgi:hypothetical protein
VGANRSDASGSQVNSSGSPSVSTNASYVFCPEAVGALSESLRHWSRQQQQQQQGAPRHHGNRSRNGSVGTTSSSSSSSLSQREVGRPFLRATNRSLHANASASTGNRAHHGSSQDVPLVSLSHAQGSPYGADAVALATGDTPYLLVLAPAVSVDGVAHIAPKWDQAAGAGGRGRPYGDEGAPGAGPGWVEIGCKVAHIRHLASIDVSAP